MKFTQRALSLTVALVAAGAMLAGPVAVTAQTPAPAAPAAPKKLISPVRGDANVEITKPNTNKKGTEVTTTIMVKNVSTAPIAGFKIEENWYDKGGVPVGGDIYRHPKPFMPGEVITVTLKTPWKASMQSNQYQFTHANGAVKPKTVPKIAPNTTT